MSIFHKNLPAEIAELSEELEKSLSKLPRTWDWHARQDVSIQNLDETDLEILRDIEQLYKKGRIDGHFGRAIIEAAKKLHSEIQKLRNSELKEKEGKILSEMTKTLESLLASYNVKVTDVREIRKLIRKHKDSLEKIMGDRKEEGEFDGLKFHKKQTFKPRIGSIAVLTVRFPNGELYEFLYKASREGGKNMLVYQSNFKYLRECYPPVLLFNDEGFLTIMLNGLEGQPFEEILKKNPRRRIQLYRESFQMIDDIFRHTPLYIQDLRINEGHNIMFNLDTKHFQLFDFDILHLRPNLSHEAKHIEYLRNRFSMKKDIKEYDFSLIIYYVNKLIRAYPKLRLKHSTPLEIYEANHPQYKNMYYQINLQAPPMGYKQTLFAGGDTYLFRPEILVAIRNKDKKLLQRIVERGPDRAPIITTESSLKRG